MKRLTTEQWIDNAIQIHGDIYSYKNAVYHGFSTKLNITCMLHGDFLQRPSDHTQGRGCPHCAGVKRWTTAEFIVRGNAVHLNRYDYSKSDYNGVHTNTTITCMVHGDFNQTPGNHINKKAGCPVCAKGRRDLAETKTTEQFIVDARGVHGDKYDYSESIYTHSHNKIKIRCHAHGMFEQVAGSHTYKSGCPMCADELKTTLTVSEGELQVRKYLDSLGILYEANTRTVITPLELDIYIPSHKIAIEYCGLYWHSEQQGRGRQYHKTKYDRCKQQGIQLVTLFEDEWKYNYDQVTRKLSSLLHCDKSQRVYARKTTPIIVTSCTKKEFFNQHHIQGNGPGSINIGLMVDDQLVACMSFIKQKDQHYLNRYATSCNVVGGFSKLLQFFIRNYEWTKLVSFADLRWSNGNMYTITGWTLDDTIPVDYSYIKGDRRVHKFNYRRNNLPKLLNHFDPELSEWENCKANNVLRIWDCGKLRYVLHNDQLDMS